MSDDNKNTMVRAFVAIMVDSEIQHRLARAQGDLTTDGAHVKWVSPDNIHLTLAFIGEVPRELAAGIGRQLDRITHGTAPFSYKVNGIGFFGAPRRPRILWAGLEAEDSLLTLHARLTDGLRELGLPIECRPFKPHLTIGRVRRARHPEALIKTAESFAHTDFGSSTADSVVLYESVLKPGGPVYSALHIATLNPA